MNTTRLIYEWARERYPDLDVGFCDTYGTHQSCVLTPDEDDFFDASHLQKVQIGAIKVVIVPTGAYAGVYIRSADGLLKQFDIADPDFFSKIELVLIR